METQLTVTVPEELYERARERALLEHVSLDDLIRERLEAFVAGWDAVEDADDIRAVDEIEARIARGEERLIEWEEFEAELDALPD